MTKRYIKYIFFSILFFSTINIVYQIGVVDNPEFSVFDLCVNLLSEFAGMIFTVLIFNEFITYRQQLTDTNKVKWLYSELEALVKALDFPFRTAAKKCVDNFDEVLWNKEVINAVRDHIVLSEVDGCVFPAAPWYLIFAMQGDQTMRKCENIRIQYQDILEPQISDYLFYLSNNSEMLTDLSNIKTIYESDLLLNYTRPQNLGSYFACPTEKDFEVVKKINEWLYLNKKESDKQTANIKKYNKTVVTAMTVVFSIGAIGYYINSRYLSAGLFTVLAIIFGFILTRFYRKK